MKQIFFLGILIMTLFHGCIEPPDYPIEPVLEFVEMTRTSVIAQTIPEDANRQVDTLFVTFSFTDGDGDLGGGNFPGLAANLRLTDTRPGVPGDGAQYLFIDDIPAAGATNGISGEITIMLPEIFCFPNSEPRDTVIYNIQLIDRAGNLSNEIQTPPIELICD